ncbi:DUF305 domain-containing protein [Rhizobium sp. P32RR-XVIII]|uniref:DUF305 domain-containing protein n=1 Tax=Rhizobium sp. P32RR-XVIII TaxID=2726738 RepID=UPI0014576370|nr:DUF305 domain-containing protein [Rhizobium sp. P32RR-XVIII]NLS06139.1 DUF305 domain-containing protein [Rhizobium sp. P32RR-XVIII]
MIARHTRRITATALVVSLAFPAFAHDPAEHAQHTASSTTSDEAPFVSENDAAMTRMMNGMAVEPTGDVNRDFVEMMIPHHQGAIDMAQAYLRYGSNEQLKRIAQEIIVDQQQEIAAMRLALGDPPPPSDPAPTQVSPPAPSSMPGIPMMPGMDPDMKMGN